MIPSGMKIAFPFSPVVSFPGDQMGEVVKFPRPDPDREVARLIQEARALYESVFPTERGPAVVERDTPPRA
jgi:hypothetical protein